MTRTVYLLTLILLIVSGCNDTRYKKTKDGMEYKIIKGSGGTKVTYKSTIKYKMAVYYVSGTKDSLLSPDFDTLPKLLNIDTSFLPKEYADIFTQTSKGDSVVTRMPVDSIRKHNPNLPPFAKNGAFIANRIKVIDVFTDSIAIIKEKANLMSQAKAIDSMQHIAQAGIDDKKLQDYFVANKITPTTKTAKGVYAVIDNPGTGDAIDSGKAVTVNYKGTTLAGKIFDQSYDSSGKPVHPFTFIVGQGRAIAGWEDGMKVFKKGGKGKLYIPSSLAYGSRPRSATIGANEILIFDVSVEDVTSGAEFEKKQQADQKAMEEARQKVMQHK